MLNIDRLWVAAVAYLPILATVATLAPLAGLAHTGIGLVVLGVAVSLSQRRRAGAAHHPAATVVGVVAATVGVGLLGAAFALSLAAGDTIFLAILFGARLIGRYGPRWAALGRALLLPLTALFLAPPVRVAHDPLRSLAGAAVAGLVASLWSALIPAVLPTPGPSVARLRRAVRAALRNRSPRTDLHEAALSLDAKLGGARDARRALATLEYTVDRYRAGAATTGEVRGALERLADAVAAVGPDRAAAPGGADVPAADPADAPSASGRTSSRTRLALQSTVAVALAFLVGQTVFPNHWPWTVITVMTVSLAARSRGEVLLRSVQRLGGAALATAAATPAATALAGHRPLTVAMILIILGAGLYLRERAYIWWAMAITSVLAFLYGLLGQTGGTDLLRERLLAIGLGAACAIGPALVFAPRSVDVVRRRTATCLRRLREALAARDVAAVRRWDAAVVDLRTAAAPLLLVRPLRRGPEAGWVDALTACGPPLRTLLVEPDDAATRATVRQLRRVLGDVATQVRATRRPA